VSRSLTKLRGTTPANALFSALHSLESRSWSVRVLPCTGDARGGHLPTAKGAFFPSMLLFLLFSSFNFLSHLIVVYVSLSWFCLHFVFVHPSSSPLSFLSIYMSTLIQLSTRHACRRHLWRTRGVNPFLAIPRCFFFVPLFLFPYQHRLSQDRMKKCVSGRSQERRIVSGFDRPKQRFKTCF
jgi:hypothetical protein